MIGRIDEKQISLLCIEKKFDREDCDLEIEVAVNYRIITNFNKLRKLEAGLSRSERRPSHGKPLRFNSRSPGLWRGSLPQANSYRV